MWSDRIMAERLVYLSAALFNAWVDDYTKSNLDIHQPQIHRELSLSGNMGEVRSWFGDYYNITIGCAASSAPIGSSLRAVTRSHGRGEIRCIVHLEPYCSSCIVMVGTKEPATRRGASSLTFIPSQHLPTGERDRLAEVRWVNSSRSLPISAS